MPIVKMDRWNEWVEANKDAYGKACVDVAREVMNLLDNPEEPMDCHGLISRADDAVKTGGITGFMAGCVAQMVSQVHSRGEEFRRAWNLENQIRDEGERANEEDGILNPAIVTIKSREPDD